VKTNGASTDFDGEWDAALERRRRSDADFNEMEEEVKAAAAA
jgi:hypothetical protein